METKLKRSEAITWLFETEKKSLELFERWLQKAESLEKRRSEILNYCRSNSESERGVWRKLSLFREAGATGILFEKPPAKVFDYLVKELRENMVQLIKELCPIRLSDFRQLVIFTERLSERIEYLCDLVSDIFLGKERGPVAGPLETTQYTDWIIHRMLREAEAIQRFSDPQAFEKLNEEYARWLADGIIDEGIVP